jgi:hypothetical protein
MMRWILLKGERLSGFKCLLLVVGELVLNFYVGLWGRVSLWKGISVIDFVRVEHFGDLALRLEFLV